jgi:hypothetical protein
LHILAIINRQNEHGRADIALHAGFISFRCIPSNGIVVNYCLKWVKLSHTIHELSWPSAMLNLCQQSYVGHMGPDLNDDPASFPCLHLLSDSLWPIRLQARPCQTSVMEGQL